MSVNDAFIQMFSSFLPFLSECHWQYRRLFELHENNVIFDIRHKNCSVLKKCHFAYFCIRTLHMGVVILSVKTTLNRTFNFMQGCQRASLLAAALYENIIISFILPFSPSEHLTSTLT